MKNSITRMGNITLVGLRAISRNKMRSSLTMLGIVIGVGCVIVVVAIGAGASQSIQNTINSLGSNFVMLQIGRPVWAGIQLSMIYLVVAQTTHRRFQPWCRRW